MKNKSVCIAAVVCLLSLAVMAAALTATGGEQETAAFVPPAFDAAAVSGTPEPADESWSLIYQEGMSFSAHVCGRVVISGSSADIYFTNDEGNEVWMKLRIMDSDGNILGETGLLRPGEYVQSITFDTVPEDGAAIKMKIMAYEPETYYSAGAVTLNTTASVIS
ncbi:MAG: hypothetical protein LUE21_02805 [Oscillospiraceae bacterium]|nr:hypothetical protein [Oscillospiraceae bacterium]